MGITELAQSVLDRVLLSDGVTSHHLRRVEVDRIGNGEIKVNRDEYVVFRLVSSRQGAFGDGKAGVMRQYLDVNYYYRYEKTDARYKNVLRRIGAVEKAFLSDRRFRLANGRSDLYDLDNPYRGINVEFLFIGVIGSEQENHT